MNGADWVILGALLTITAAAFLVVWAVLTDRWWASRAALVAECGFGTAGVGFLVWGIILATAQSAA